MMRRGILIGLLILTFLVAGVGCNASSSVNNPPINQTTTNRSTTTTNPPPPPTTIGSISNVVLNGGDYREFHTYATPGQTLIFTWASDSSAEGFILTVTQFNTFKVAGSLPNSPPYSNGKSSSVSLTIQNGDTYYAVVANRILFGAAFKVYSAELVVK